MRREVARPITIEPLLGPDLQDDGRYVITMSLGRSGIAQVTLTRLQVRHLISDLERAVPWHPADARVRSHL